MPLGLIATKWHLTHVTFNLILYMIFATISITIYDICHLFLGFLVFGFLVFGVFVCFFWKSYLKKLSLYEKEVSDVVESHLDTGTTAPPLLSPNSNTITISVIILAPQSPSLLSNSTHNHHLFDQTPNTHSSYLLPNCITSEKERKLHNFRKGKKHCTPSEKEKYCHVLASLQQNSCTKRVLHSEP